MRGSSRPFNMSEHQGPDQHSIPMRGRGRGASQQRRVYSQHVFNGRYDPPRWEPRRSRSASFTPPYFRSVRSHSRDEDRENGHRRPRLQNPPWSIVQGADDIQHELPSSPSSGQSTEVNVSTSERESLRSEPSTVEGEMSSVSEEQQGGCQVVNTLPPHRSLAGDFVGRTAELAMLAEMQGPALSNRHGPRLDALISGLAGVGKSQLALKFADEQSAHFCAVVIASGTDLQDGLLSACAELDLPDLSRHTLVLRLSAVYAALQRKCAEDRAKALLVLDGVEDPQQAVPYLPEWKDTPDVFVVVTSRCPTWPCVLHVPLGGLQPEDSVHMLLAMLDKPVKGEEVELAETPKLSEIEAQKLATSYGHFPLGIRFLGSFLQHKRQMRVLKGLPSAYSLADYLADHTLDQDGVYLHEFPAAGELVSLADWSRSAIDLPQGPYQDTAIKILKMLAHCVSGPVPMNLLASMPSTHPQDYLEGVMLLKSKSLVRCTYQDDQTTFVEINPLLSTALIWDASKNTEEYQALLLDVLVMCEVAAAAGLFQALDHAVRARFYSSSGPIHERFVAMLRTMLRREERRSLEFLARSMRNLEQIFDKDTATLRELYELLVEGLVIFEMPTSDLEGLCHTNSARGLRRILCGALQHERPKLARRIVSAIGNSDLLAKVELEAGLACKRWLLQEGRLVLPLTPQARCALQCLLLVSCERFGVEERAGPALEANQMRETPRAGGIHTGQLLQPLSPRDQESLSEALLDALAYLTHRNKYSICLAMVDSLLPLTTKGSPLYARLLLERAHCFIVQEQFPRAAEVFEELAPEMLDRRAASTVELLSTALVLACQVFWSSGLEGPLFLVEHFCDPGACKNLCGMAVKRVRSHCLEGEGSNKTNLSRAQLEQRYMDQLGRLLIALSSQGCRRPLTLLLLREQLSVCGGGTHGVNLLQDMGARLGVPPHVTLTTEHHRQMELADDLLRDIIEK